jgi:SAM-dependent methyltransferase
MTMESRARIQSVRLNLGCGHTLHPDWLNVDIVPTRKGVLRCDLTRTLPFPSASFEAVYCSHVLEHLRPEHVPGLMSEISRVLRPGGIVRLVVPDLERIAVEYLALLADLRNGRPGREADYDWILLEMYDQAVRNAPGGRMAPYLKRKDLPNRAYIVSRVGKEAESLWQKSAAGGFFARVRRARFPELLRALRERIKLRYRLTSFLVWAVGGAGALRAFREGSFRRNGEIHQWMYDSYSLGKLLREAGFVDPTAVTARFSAIADFAGFGLDVDENGAVRKPDSLFMEARRPVQSAAQANR